MHHNSKIPEPGTYDRVLRRYDRDPRFAHQQVFVSYDVSLRAVSAPMAATGEAMTLFFPKGKEAAAHRATRHGWVDCTAAWHKALAEPTLAEFSGQLEAMGWDEIRTLALARGVGSKMVKRTLLTASLIEHERARLLAVTA